MLSRTATVEENMADLQVLPTFHTGIHSCGRYVLRRQIWRRCGEESSGFDVRHPREDCGKLGLENGRLYSRLLEPDHSETT